MEVNPFNDEENSTEIKIKVKPYWELIGCLIFIILNVRLDLSAAVNYYGRLQGNAKGKHWKASNEYSDT